MTNPAPSGPAQRTRRGHVPVPRPISRWGRAKLAAAALAVGAVALTPFAVGQGSAQASPASVAPSAAPASVNQPCFDNEGITVVIDFQDLPVKEETGFTGGVNVRCASGPVRDGLDAFVKADISYQTTARFAGFVCKIAGLPADDPCQTASPADAYWSYWIAPRGGQWCYSNLGAGARTGPLPPGSIEGWSFSKDKQSTTTAPPRYVPPAAIPGQAPNPIPRSDCDGAVPQPPNPGPPATTPTTTSGSGTTPGPTTTTSSGGSAGGGTSGAAAGGAGAGAAGPGSTPTSGAGPSTTAGDVGTPDADPSTIVPADQAALEDLVETGVGEPMDMATAVAKGLVQTNPDGSHEALGDVDLSSNGSAEGNLGGVAVALAAIVVLAGGALTLARRRRASGST